MSVMTQEKIFIGIFFKISLQNNLLSYTIILVSMRKKLLFLLMKLGVASINSAHAYACVCLARIAPSMAHWHLSSRLT